MSRSAKRRPSVHHSNPVHLTFKSHPADEPYMSSPFRAGPKGVVYENAYGRRGFGVKGPFDPSKSSSAIFDQSRISYLLEAGASGARVVAGESAGRFPLSIFRLWRLRRLRKGAFSSASRMMTNPSLVNIRSHFLWRAKFDNYRHQLIVKTIKKLIKRGETPIEVRYGTNHSVLSPLLERKGISTRRDFPRQKFSWYEIVLRRLMVKGTSARISSLDYKKGFISEIFLGRIFDLLPFSVAQTDATVRDIALIDRRLLDHATESMLDTVIAKYVEKKDWLAELCVVNGMKHAPTYHQLLAFAKK